MTSDAKLHSGTSHTHPHTPQHPQHPLAASSSQAVSFLSNKCHASTSLLVALLPGQLAFAPPTLLLLIQMMITTMTKMMMIACCKMTFPLPPHQNQPSLIILGPTLSPSFWNALAPDVTTRSRTRERKGTNISASLLLALAAPTVSTRSCVRAATDRVRARAAHLGKCTLHHTWAGGK